VICRLERERVEGLREGRQATPKEWNDASQEYAAAVGKAPAGPR